MALASNCAQQESTVDGATKLGEMSIQCVLHRRDCNMANQTRLPVIWSAVQKPGVKSSCQQLAHRAALRRESQAFDPAKYPRGRVSRIFRKFPPTDWVMKVCQC